MNALNFDTLSEFCFLFWSAFIVVVFWITTIELLCRFENVLFSDDKRD